jgi:hypothetical protein
MSLAAYALRRTIGALLVLLIVVLVTQFAVNRISPPPLRLPGSHWPAGLEDRVQMQSVQWALNRIWADFPQDTLLALAAITLGVLAWRTSVRFAKPS